MKANAMGFYSPNGGSVIEFPERSRAEDVKSFLHKVRANNGDRPIVTILDNFPSHRNKQVIQEAENLNMNLVFLPCYSPDLNPIEFIWKSIKRIISLNFIQHVEHLKKLIEVAFNDLSRKTSCAKAWTNRFLAPKLVQEVLV
jgi:transposase